MKVHFNLFDPASGFHLFGKPKANTPTEYQYVECSQKDCVLRRQGCCAAAKMINKSCPYGTYHRVVGPTKRARSFRTWQSKAREEHKGIPYLKSPPDKLAIIGEYVYIPYAHVNMNENLPFSSKGGFMCSGSQFLKLSDFTVDNIAKILNFYPQAFFGGGITSYQTEEMPKFIAHLEEVFPQLYKELLTKYVGFVEKYKLDKPKNYVGREAYIKTIAPCVFYTKGSREGDYKVKWTWDGNKLITDSYHAYNETWGEVKNYENLKVEIIPSETSTVVISDNSQVTKETIFIN